MVQSSKAGNTEREKKEFPIIELSAEEDSFFFIISVNPFNQMNDSLKYYKVL